MAMHGSSTTSSRLDSGDGGDHITSRIWELSAALAVLKCKLKRLVCMQGFSVDHGDLKFFKFGANLMLHSFDS